MREVTFGFVKPDAYTHRQEILEELILPSGLHVVVAKDPYFFTEEKAREHYDALREAVFFDILIQFTVFGLSGLNSKRYGERRESPTSLYVLEGEDAVKTLDCITGLTNPGLAKADAMTSGRQTIRSRYGRGMPDNAFHRADSHRSARREIQLYFTKDGFRRINREDIWEMIHGEPYV